MCAHTHTHMRAHIWTHASTLTLACTLFYISHLLKLELINSPECDRRKQANEMALHVLCDCKALDFMKPGDLEEICVVRILHFVQKIKYGQGPWVTTVPTLLVFLYSVQPKSSQMTTGCGTSHLRYKICSMSKTQEYIVGCYTMFNDKFDIHGTMHHYCIS